jgi:hypothetical protein
MEQNPGEANRFLGSQEILGILWNLQVRYGIYKCRHNNSNNNKNRVVPEQVVYEAINEIYTAQYRAPWRTLFTR